MASDAPLEDEVREKIVSENEKLAYTGKEHDDATGLTYFGARYYGIRTQAPRR